MHSYFGTSPELVRSGCDTAVLPLGSVEPKGPHLPVGLDLILADRFSRDFCLGRSVYLLPVFPFSSAPEALDFPGVVSLSQQTLFDVLRDVADVLYRQEFRRLVVLDFSLYNWIVKPAVRELNLDSRKIQTVWVRPKEFARESVAPDLLPDHGGGAVETAIAMHVAGELVGTIPADHCPALQREIIDFHGLKAAAPEGYWGRPSGATPALGERLYAEMLEESRKFVDTALRFFPDGTGLAAGVGDDVGWGGGGLPGVGDAAAGGSRAADWRSSVGRLARGRTELAVLPTGALEQHSAALPLGTDFLQALEIGRRVAEETGGYLLPALPIVTSWGHIHFRGTVSLRAMTVRRLLEDVAASLAAGGTRRLVVVNTHGGNWVLKPTIVEMNRKYGDLLRIISPGDILAYRGQASVESLHADAMEASFIRAYHCETFHGDAVADESPNCSASAFDFVGMRGVSPQGVWGFPSRSSAARGRRETEKRIREAVDYIRRHFGSAGGRENERS